MKINWRKVWKEYRDYKGNSYCHSHLHNCPDCMRKLSEIVRKNTLRKDKK